MYIGLCVATLFGSFIFNTISAKYIIAVMVVLNAVSCYVFVCVNDLYILYGL